MNSLKDGIKRKVKTCEPQTEPKAIHLAKRIKNELYVDSMMGLERNLKSSIS